MSKVAFTVAQHTAKAGWMEVKELERRNLTTVFHLTSGDWIENNSEDSDKVKYRDYSPVTRKLDKYSDKLKHSREQMELTWLWARCRLGLTHDESETKSLRGSDAAKAFLPLRLLFQEANYYLTNG